MSRTRNHPERQGLGIDDRRIWRTSRCRCGRRKDAGRSHCHRCLTKLIAAAVARSRRDRLTINDGTETDTEAA